MLLKLLLLACGMLAVSAKEIKNPLFQKTFHSEYFNRQLEDIETNLEGGAVVLKSNLPVAIQNQLAAALTQIYQSVSDPLTRAQRLQATASQVYSVYWNVVIDFNVITFYSQYYILFQINGDRVLAFGLS